ncbi:MAG: LytTR family DNA-binding domain-containing protein [Sphaerochaeta sp.]
MQIDVKIDSSVSETKVIIIAGKMDAEIDALLKMLSCEQPKMIAGFRNDEMQILEQETISKIYACDGKVFAKTQNCEFLLKMRLYEIEERLDKSCFVRISNSEIINLKKVKSFDLSMSGTIYVVMQDRTVAFVSRRYVQKIKKTLGL